MSVNSVLDALYDIEMCKFNVWMEVSQTILNNDSKQETITICEQDQSIILERFTDDVNDELIMEAVDLKKYPLEFPMNELTSEDINELKRIKYDPVSHTREGAYENKKIATMLVVVYNSSHYEKNDNKSVQLKSSNMMKQVTYGYKAKSFYINEIIKALDAKKNNIFEYVVQGDQYAKDQHGTQCIIAQINMTLPYEAINPKLFKICKLADNLDKYKDKTYTNEYKKTVDELNIKYGKTPDEAFQIRRDVCYVDNPKERVYREYFLSFHLQKNNKEYNKINEKANSTKDPFDKSKKHGLSAAKRLKYQFDL